MELWSDGSNWWPAIFSAELFGNTVPGRELEPAPLPAIEAFKEGQLLAYLTESGIGSTFLKADPSRGPGMLISDFRHLEVLETKPDYARYGGAAVFRVDADEKRLVLHSLLAPLSGEVTLANPRDVAFRDAEARILAS